MAASLARIIVSVTDLDRALAFYGGVLGFEPFWRGTDVARLKANGLELLLHQRETTPSERAVAASFRVENVDASTAAAVAVGATIIDEPADQPWGERQSVLRDPDGHVVCLVHATK